MRYKQTVTNHVDTITNVIQLIKRGLQNSSLTPEEILVKINQILDSLEDVSNLLDKEIESMN